MKKNLRSLNRNGVTLLFVISMIVLFLLMGTTFVVVSNEFRKSSRERSLLTVNDIASVGERLGDRYVLRALYDLLRGPDLNEINSPLRGHSILGDMYGYGMTSYVSSIETLGNFAGLGTEQQFLRLELRGADLNIYDDAALIVAGDLTNANVIGNDVLTGETVTLADIGNAPGRFNGNLLSFVSGPLEGSTSRIIDHQVFFDNMNADDPTHKFVVMLLNQPETFRVSQIDSFVVDLSEANGTQLPSRVVVNGRPFSGTGAGRFNPTLAGGALSGQALEPNRQGQTRDELVDSGMIAGVREGYFAIGDGTGAPRANPFATNEPYDAVDEQNMFLAAMDSSGMVTVPSFDRAGLTGRTFRMQQGVNASTAEMFDTGDVIDHSGDGNPDGFWMDLGYPIFTTQDGTRVKPLVSFLVTDLDGRMNINFHGNRSQLATHNNFSNPMFETPYVSASLANLRGGGLGPAEVRMANVFDDPMQQEMSRLIVGKLTNPATSSVEVEIPGRYGFDSLPSGAMGYRLAGGGGPSPGLPAYVGFDGADPFAVYKQFGLPVSADVSVDAGVLGRHYQSRAMDVYGRFRTDFPNIALNGVPVGMPAVDVGESTLNYTELANSPYEIDASPPGKQIGLRSDQLFTPNELEHIYRRGDGDLANRSDNRIVELLEDLTGFTPKLLDSSSRFVATTDSWEVPTSFTEFLGTQADPLGTLRNETLVTKLYDILSHRDATGTILTGTAGIGVPMQADELVREQLVAANISGFQPQTNTTSQFSRVSQLQFGMLSSDVRAGRPFNINRPFGDGLDNTTPNGIVDDAMETGEVLARPTSVSDPLSPNLQDKAFDHDNDSVVGGNSYQAKAQFARQLFVLTLLATELVDRDGDGTIFNAGETGFDDGDFMDFNDSGAIDPIDRIDFRKVVAQWVANVVDYRDPDSIMTGLEFDLNPWNGWDVNGDLTTNDGAQTGFLNYFVAWGVERPELLMTEAFAMHDTRIENLDTETVLSSDPNDVDMAEIFDGTLMGDDDFDSRLVPQASAFIELYNPWAGGNQRQPAEFDATQTGIDLKQIATNVSTGEQYPVWRIVVLRNQNVFENAIAASDPMDPPPFMGEDGWDPTDPLFDPDNANLLSNAADDGIRRYIYFAPLNVMAGDQFIGPKVYSPATGAGTLVIGPGGYGVVGSAGQLNGDAYTTFISRNQNAAGALDLTQTRRIELDPVAEQVRVWSTDEVTTTAQNVKVLPIDNGSGRSLGFSDPVNGYSSVGIADPHPDPIAMEGEIFQDAGGMSVIFDEPVDRSADPDFYFNYLQENKLISGAYVLVLQRLADPTQPWNAVTNPYRTTDSTGCDLYAFNGIDSAVSEDSMLEGGEEDYFSTFERRSNRQANSPLGQDEMNNRFRMLWKTEYSGLNPTGTDSSSQMNVAMPALTHVFQRELVHSLGTMNSAYVNANSQGPIPFTWLNWNNRPFSSGYELMNVPYTSSYHLTNKFDIAQSESGGGFNPYNPPMTPDVNIRADLHSGDFPHLLNFFDDGNITPSLFRLFDYIEVPSRYVGTETYLNPDQYVAAAGSTTQISRGFAAPYDFVSNYRVPGKININTVSDPDVWNAVVDPFGLGLATLAQWQTSLTTDGPFRPAVAANYGTTSENDIDTGVFRPIGGDPMFELDLDNAQDQLGNTERNAYYRYHEYQRIANSITNRSSVFAIWVQVGYFEVINEAGNEVVGNEYEDVNDGTTTNRGFFIVDRSIPVAFEPGKNHNVDRAIRVSSFIE